MASKRRRFSAQEKVRLLRLHLIEKQPVSSRPFQTVEKAEFCNVGIETGSSARYNIARILTD